MPLPGRKQPSAHSKTATNGRPKDAFKADFGLDDIPLRLERSDTFFDDSQISPGSFGPDSSPPRDHIAPWDEPAPPPEDNSKTRQGGGGLKFRPPRGMPSLEQLREKRKQGSLTAIQSADASPPAPPPPPTASNKNAPRPDKNHRTANSTKVSRPGNDRRPSDTSSSDMNPAIRGRSRANQKKTPAYQTQDQPRSLNHQISQPILPRSHPSPEFAGDWARPNYGRPNTRQGSFTNVYGQSREASPGQSRPRTPQPPGPPSSEVTPWLYQDAQDITYFGDAPVRDNLNIEKQQTSDIMKSSSHNSHKFHLPKHRSTKSTEEASTGSPDLERVETFPSLGGSSSNTRAPSESKDKLSHHSSSPPQSGGNSRPNSTNSRGGGNDSGKKPKRSLFDRIRHRNKTDRQPQDTGGSLSVDDYPDNGQMPFLTPSRSNLGSSPSGIIEDTGSSLTPAPSHTNLQNPSKKEHHARLPFKTKRGPSNNDISVSKDPSEVRSDISSHANLWNLDTNLSDMAGIVNAEQQPMLTKTQTNWVHGDPNENFKDKQNPSTIAGVWDAPDSWAVKRVGDENVEKLHEIDEAGNSPTEGDPGVPFAIRIYRQDLSYATISVPLSTTSAELIQLLGKKTFPLDDLNKFSIIMRKHETSRQLNPGERPLALQKRMLELVGYNDSDHIEEIGRDDHSYLCRFIFLSAKSIGYSSLEKDPAFNKMQKFSFMDLQGRNLTTIPIALYQKSSEIVVLNLSRNLSIDVPKDFVQGCTSLREIRYTGNEASRLPLSFNLAAKLTVLDISNNRLDQLDYASLEQLENLASLKLSNNKLTSLPEAFASFKSLRNLNLSSNFLWQLPECVCKIKSLVDLDISFNAISDIPAIANLENLERLWATNNRLSGRPEESVANMKNLREVDIRFNLIDNIDVLSSLPQLEHLFAGHNSITAFDGTFQKIRTLQLDHNPVTRFDLKGPNPSLSTLNLASAKLVQLPNDMFNKLSGLTKLVLTKNHFASLSPQIGRLGKLEHLSVAKNSLNSLPLEISRLAELRFLDVRENNITQLPPDIWLCRKLETLNVSSNCLEGFPKSPSNASLAELENQNASSSSGADSSLTSSEQDSEDLDKVGEFGLAPSTTRRMSQTSANSSPGNSHRKGSLASLYGQSPRKVSNLSRMPTDQTLAPISRKDSIPVNRITATFAGSLRVLSLADNRLGDEIFDQISKLPELRIVNLSYNELYDIPSRMIRRWQFLTEIYLSGNELASLPAEDFEDCTSLKVIHINGNKFQVLPAELGKIQKLTILDASSNSLKYNVSNWPYDWNWNWNRNLKYLNMSGNKRLEIKQSSSYSAGRDAQDLTDFSTLPNLRILGLMDVTLMIPSVPDQTEDRRVRTSGSTVGTMAYGISDCLGNNEHLSTIDIVVPRLEGHDDETLIGLFDGIPLTTGGSKIVKYLQDNFERQFKEELRHKHQDECPSEALRRTYLALNKDLGTWASQSRDMKDRRGNATPHRGSVVSQMLGQEDLNSGCVATVLYLHQMDLYVSNVGNAEALLIQSEGGHRCITRRHDPAEKMERLRIREAGGYVSRQGKLNDTLDVSRAFGFTHLVPAVIAAPHISRIQIQETDEMILLASRELWEYLSPDFAVDLARSERGDLMRASQKLRDLAIAFGATSKITVMLIGVSDLRKRERAKFRTHSMSMGPSGLPDEYMGPRRVKRGREVTVDSKLARLNQEVEAPVGEVSLVFTDIKNSTLLWETYQDAMRSAIRMHNETMRRHLRLIGGYEVKTEGDAFMVAFPTVTSALLWCFTIQSSLLEQEWPQEIVSSVHGQEVADADGNVLFRGLSVRMGIHWGSPVCEIDPVTRRMDYFGPMVNRASRISGVADGGQITVSSDFIAEVQRLLETHIESDRSNSTGSDDQASEDALSLAIRRELRSLSSHGFEVKDLGEKRLKGLENPEYIYLMYPHSLAGRLEIQQQRAEAERATAEAKGQQPKDGHLTIDLENMWELWAVSLRLEMLCSTLECPGSAELKPPETALLERTRERGSEVTDRFLMNFVEHQISRIETCTTSLALRNLVRPFKQGMLDKACPMAEIFQELSGHLGELKAIKEQIDIEMAPS